MRPIVITGARGTLGRAFVRACESRGLAYRALSRADLDITNVDDTLRVFDRLEPWLVVNTAGYVRVDDAESDATRCYRDNVLGPAMLARCTSVRSIRLVTFSSDLVFDGRARDPYCEHDMPAPLGVYGKSKHDAEKRTLEAHAKALVVRTSAFFGPGAPYDFVAGVKLALDEGKIVRAAQDAVVSPTYVPDLVDACLDLAIDDACGIWHLANSGAISWVDFARTIARMNGFDEERVIGVEGTAIGWRARRPAYSALRSSHGQLLSPLAHALQRHFANTERTHG